jgi:hypothetical protein
MVIINAFSSVFYLCWINLSIIFLSSVPYIMCLSLNHLHAYHHTSNKRHRCILVSFFQISFWSAWRTDNRQNRSFSWYMYICICMYIYMEITNTNVYMCLVHKLSITYIFDHPSIFTRASSTNISLTKCLYLLWICLHILSIFCIHFHIDTWDLFGNYL